MIEKIKVFLNRPSRKELEMKVESLIKENGWLISENCWLKHSEALFKKEHLNIQELAVKEIVPEYVMRKTSFEDIVKEMSLGFVERIPEFAEVKCEHDEMNMDYVIQMRLKVVKSEDHHGS